MSKNSMSDLLSLEDEGSSKKKGFLGGLFNRSLDSETTLSEPESRAADTTAATPTPESENPAYFKQETMLDLPELEEMAAISTTNQKSPTRSSKQITANLGVGSKLFSGIDQSFHAMRQQDEVTELDLPELDLPLSSSESDLDLAGLAITTNANQESNVNLTQKDQSTESSDSVLDFMDLMQLKADPIKHEEQPELDYELPVSIKPAKSDNVLRAIESALTQVTPQPQELESPASTAQSAVPVTSVDTRSKSSVPLVDEVQPSHTIPLPHPITFTTTKLTEPEKSKAEPEETGKEIAQPHLVAIESVTSEYQQAEATALVVQEVPVVDSPTEPLVIKDAEVAIETEVESSDSDEKLVEPVTNFSSIVSLFTDEEDSFDLSVLDIEDEIFVNPASNKDEFLSPEELAVVEYREAIAEEEKSHNDLDHEAIAEESKDLAQGVVTDISKIAPIDTLVNLAAVPNPVAESEEVEEDKDELLGYDIPKITTPITPRFVPNEQQVFDTQVLGTEDSIFIIRIPTKTVDQARMDNVPPEMLADYHRYNGNFEEAARQDAIAASRIIPPPISLERIIPPPTAVPATAPKPVAPPNIIAPPSLIPVPVPVVEEPEEPILALRNAHGLEVIEFERALSDRQEQVKANLVGEELLPPTPAQQLHGQVYIEQEDFNEFDKLTEADLFVNRRSPITDRNAEGWTKHPAGYIPVPSMSKAEALAHIARSAFIDEEDKQELIAHYDELELDYMLYNNFSPEIAEYSKAFIVDFEAAAAEASQDAAEQTAVAAKMDTTSLVERVNQTLQVLAQDATIKLSPQADNAVSYVQFTPVGLDLVELNPSQEVVFSETLTDRQQQIKTQLAGELYELPEDDYDLILQENLYIVQDSVPEDEILRDEDRFVNRRSQNGDYNEQGWLAHDQSYLPAPRILLLSDLVPQATGFLRFVLGYGDLQKYFARKISRLTVEPQVPPVVEPVGERVATEDASVVEVVTEPTPTINKVSEAKPNKVIAPPNVNLLLSSALQLREQLSKGSQAQAVTTTESDTPREAEPQTLVSATSAPAEVAESAARLSQLEAVLNSSVAPATDPLGNSTVSLDKPLGQAVTIAKVENSVVDDKPAADSEEAKGFSNLLPNAAPLFFTPSKEQADSAPADSVADTQIIVAQDQMQSQQEQQALAQAYQELAAKQAEQELIQQELISSELDRKQLQSQQFANYLDMVVSKAKSVMATKVEASTETSAATQEESKAAVAKMQPSPFVTSSQSLANTFVNPFVTKAK